MVHPDDDMARNVQAQQNADAMPTDEELREAKEEKERQGDAIKSLVREGVEAGLITHVFTEAQKGFTVTKPNDLKTVAKKVDSDVDETHVRDSDALFRSQMIRAVADELGLDIEEEETDY